MTAEGKRATLGGMDCTGTREAIEVFVNEGRLERFPDLAGAALALA